MSRLLDIPNDDLRFADRVTRMQQALRLLGTEVTSGSNSHEPVGDAPTDILGLHAVASGTAITLRWNPLFASNLRHYEVNIGNRSDLADAVLRVTQAPEYTDTEGGPNTVRYARVRGVFADGVPAAWSGTINLDSGLLITDSLAFEAALNYNVVAFGDGTGPYLCEALTGRLGGMTARVAANSHINNGGTNWSGAPTGLEPYVGNDLQALYPAAVPITTIGGPVQLRASMTAEVFFSADSGYRIKVLRDGEVVLDLGNAGYPRNTSMISTVSLYMPGISFIEIPPPGDHVYEIEVRAGGPSSVFEAVTCRIAALEYRR